MNPRISLRLAIASVLLSASSLAMAQTYVASSVPGTAVALTQNGSVLGYENNTNGTQSLYLTGANGGSPVVSLGGTTAGPYGPYGPMSSSGPFATGYSTPAAAGTARVASSAPGLSFSSSFATLVGANDSGAVAANASYYTGTSGVVLNSNGSLTSVGGLIAGINASGAVVFSTSNTALGGKNIALTTVPSSLLPVVESVLTPIPGGTYMWAGSETIGAGTSYVLAGGSLTPSAVADLGYGSRANALNASAQVTGAIYNGPIAARADYIEQLVGGVDMGNWSYPSFSLAGINGQAFRTGANGAGVTLFGTGGGIASVGTAINDAGQVGGDITLAGGQTEAFITTATGSLMVGIGAGAPGDSTTVAYLNDLGQAIIEDNTRDSFFLYSDGEVVALTSLGAPAYDQVVGFNDAGQILLADPELLSPVTPVVSLASIAGAYANSSTGAYAAVAGAEGYAPTASFDANPTHSTDGAFAPYTPGSSPGGGSPVPAPGVLGLLGAGFAMLLGARRRKGVVGV